MNAQPYPQPPAHAAPVQATPAQYTCPYCDERPLETVARVPYVRGYVVAYTVGYKKMIGCKKCVRKAIYKEAGKSGLLGWFSVTALFLNPVCISYGLVRGVFVGTNPKAVQKQLAAAGLPASPQSVQPLQIAYGLAAAVIAADGKVEAEEVQVAIHHGSHLFHGFDPQWLHQAIGNHKDLPAPEDLAALLANILDDQAKSGVFHYLQSIAAADGNIAAEEQAVLDAVSRRLWPQQAFAAS